jgi:dTMP kinase
MTAAPPGSCGPLVSVDEPGGVGKSTVCAAVTGLLTSHGVPVRLTREPSPTPLGELIRAGTGEYHGMALACLVAGDRHHHLASEIRPRRAAGEVVLSDRYLPSSFVLQRIDGLPWETIAALNEGADVPGLAVILTADPAVTTARLERRGGHSRFEAMPDTAATETALYHDAARRLAGQGWPVCQMDATVRTPDELAAGIVAQILAICQRETP